MKMTEEKQTEEEQHIDLRKIRETFAKDRFATENGAYRKHCQQVPENDP